MIKLIKQIKKINFVYQVNSVKDVTVDLIAKTKWPLKARGLGFVFRRSCEDAYRVLWDNVRDKYFIRVHYYARKRDIRVKEIKRPSAIEEYTFPKESLLRKT
jgi:hypothetical protein